MQKYYSISIPKPCHEDWNGMTPKDKGRFCDSCVKTVVDFTKMTAYEIQVFINENKDNRICGHFKQSQLNSINIHVSSKTLERHQSFQKIFLLVLLITMGTTLLNCTNKNGDKQKIDSVEVVDTLSKKIINVTGQLPLIPEKDTVLKKSCNKNSKTSSVTNKTTDGLLVTETMGDIEIVEKPPIEIDSVDAVTPPEIMGDMETEEYPILGFISIETPPQFKNTPQSLSIQEKRDYFQREIQKIVTKNFNISVCPELKGTQKLYTQFKIDTLGNIKDIKVRAPHIKLEKEAKRVLQLLPQFIPAKQSNKSISTVYTLPIIFQAE